jgi:hypothetical protein
MTAKSQRARLLKHLCLLMVYVRQDDIGSYRNSTSLERSRTPPRLTWCTLCTIICAVRQCTKTPSGRAASWRRRQPTRTLALRSRRYEHMRDDLRVYSAGKKLDHLIRRALDPMIRYIGPSELSAIMVFLDEFDRTFPKMRITDQARQWIEPRIALCREMIGVAKQEYEAYG